MTKTVAFCSLKGGTGKTTLSYNLLERALSVGLRCAVVDFDPQRGALELLRLREQYNEDGGLWSGWSAQVNAAGASELAAARASGDYDLLICDLPGSDSMALLRVLREVDLVLSPVGGSFLDLASGRELSEYLEAGGLSACFIGNNLPPYAVWETDFRRDLDSMGLTGGPVALRRRTAYMRSVLDGQGVCEWERRQPAAREVIELWHWLAGELDLPAGESFGDPAAAPSGPENQGMLAGLTPAEQTEEGSYAGR